MAGSGLININEMLGITDTDKKIQYEQQEHQNNVTVELELTRLVPFFNHPFKLYDGERLDDMVESIKEHGIIMPLIVRPKEDGKYEILSGHNRVNAGKIAGLTKAPVVIKEDLTDEEAMLIVTETNLIQRSFAELAVSEKAKVITERHRAIKQQGRRTDLINEIENLCKADETREDLTSYQIDKKLGSIDKIGNKYDLSSAMVSRYLRIDTLSDNLKIRLDTGEIPLMAGVDLSFLKKDEQNIVDDILQIHGFKVNLKKSSTLKKYSKKDNLTYEKVFKILSGEYFNKPKKYTSFKFTSKFQKKLSKYFNETQSQNKIEKIIENALDLYFSQIKDLESEEGNEIE